MKEVQFSVSMKLCRTMMITSLTNGYSWLQGERVSKMPKNDCMIC